MLKYMFMIQWLLKQETVDMVQSLAIIVKLEVVIWRHRDTEEGHIARPLGRSDLPCWTGVCGNDSSKSVQIHLWQSQTMKIIRQ